MTKRESWNQVNLAWFWWVAHCPHTVQFKLWHQQYKCLASRLYVPSFTVYSQSVLGHFISSTSFIAQFAILCYVFVGIQNSLCFVFGGAVIWCWLAARQTVRCVVVFVTAVSDRLVGCLLSLDHLQTKLLDVLLAATVRLTNNWSLCNITFLTLQWTSWKNSDHQILLSYFY